MPQAGRVAESATLSVVAVAWPVGAHQPDPPAEVFGSVAAAAHRAVELLQRARADGFAPAILVHTGEASGDGVDGGSVVDEAARYLALAPFGRVVCTAGAAALLTAARLPGLWLVPIPGLPLVAVQPVEADVRGQGLPVWRTSLIGREAALAATAELLDQGGLVTITGPAGVGKTRLAAAVASRWATTIPVWFVPLQELADGEHLAAAVLAGMRLTLSGDRAADEQLRDAVRSMTGLLLLDNLEHLLDAGVPLVWDLLQAGGNLTVLVTSRERLGLAGEQILELGPLDTGGDSTAVSESLQLLLDRLRSARPDLAPEVLARPELGQLCRRVDGLPLALELAAAQVAADPAGAWLETLDDGLALVAAPAAADDRHGSLRAAIDWSYRLLSPAVQHFFQTLAVFRGSWDLEAAEAVADDPFTIDHLEALHRASLVVVEAWGDTVRYRLLEAMRAFAAERLAAAGLAGTVTARHHATYLAVAEQHSAVLENEGETPAALRQLDADLENLRSALAWARREGPAAALPLAAALWRYWLVRGHWREAYTTLDAILVSGAGALTPSQRIQALGWLGHLCYRLGRHAEAVDRLQEALDLATPAGDRAAAGNALNELGKVAWAEGDYARARRLFEQALAIRRELDNPWGVAATLANLGAVTDAEGDYPAARALVEEGLAIRERIADRRGVASSLNNLGVLAFQIGDCREATALLGRSADIRRTLGDRSGLASCLNDAGSVALHLGDLDDAERALTESLEIRRALGDRRGMARTLNNLGIIATARQAYDVATDCYAEALAIQESTGDLRGVAMTANNLGDGRLAAGDAAGAEGHFRRALQLGEQLGDPRTVALAGANLGHVAVASQAWDAADERYRQSLTGSEALGDRWLSAVNHHGLAQTALGRGAAEQARREFAEALQLRRLVGDLSGAADSLAGLAVAHAALDEPERATVLEASAEAIRQGVTGDWRTVAEQALEV